MCRTGLSRSWAHCRWIPTRIQNLGYIEGKNIVVEYRYYEGNLDRVPGLVGELVQLKVDVLIVSSTSDTRRQASNHDDPYCRGDISGSRRGRIDR